MNAVISIQAGVLEVRWVNYIMYRRPRKAITQAIYRELLPDADQAKSHRLQYATATIYKTGVEVSVPTPNAAHTVSIWTGENNRRLLERRLREVENGKLLADCPEGVLTPPCH